MGDVLVTGVTGFVGSALAERLAEEGHEVRGLSRDPARAREAVKALDAAFAWPSAKDPVPLEAVEDTSAIVHLAGESVAGRWTQKKMRAIEGSRRDGTRAIVDAIARAERPPKVLVSASAIGYYGSRGDEELTETSSPGDDFLARVCKVWEEEALRAEDHGVRVVRLRIGLVMGQGGGPLQPMLPLFKAGLGGRIGDGRQWWPWIHVDDVVGMAIEAVTNPRWIGAFNATAPKPVRQEDFAKTLARVLKRPAFVPAPALALKTILGRFSTELLASHRVLPKRAVDLGYRFAHHDLVECLHAAT